MLSININLEQENFRNKLEKKINFLREEVQIRCESLSNEIDVFAKELNRDIDSLKYSNKNVIFEISNRSIDFIQVGKVCK
jgi:hypothetical protein